MGDYDIRDPNIWGSLYKKLCKKAACELAAMKMLNKGISPEDIAQEVLLDVLKSGDLCGWDPHHPGMPTKIEESIEVFLKMIVKRKVIDNQRSHVRHPNVPIDPEGNSGPGASNRASHGDVIMDIPDPSCSVETTLSCSEQKIFLLKVAAGDRVAIAIINVSEHLSGSGKVNQELAFLIFGDSKDTKEIINARKRLLRKLLVELESERNLCMKKPMGFAINSLAKLTQKNRRKKSAARHR